MADVVHTLDNGDTVILNNQRRSLVFNITDIYQYKMPDYGDTVYKNGTGVYLPNENDLVYAYELGWFRVSRADTTTFIVDLVAWRTNSTVLGNETVDPLLGTGPGYPSETWRCYVDTRVFPYRLGLDSQLIFRGSEVSEVRIFRGINVTSTGEVISAYYNANGEYVNDAIPLEIATVDNINNLTQKSAKMGYTVKELSDGEIVTAVPYNTFGQALGFYQLLVHKTNLVRAPDALLRRVQGISLLSNYLSDSEPDVLIVPLNITMGTMALRAKVTYTDGTSETMDLGDEDSNARMTLAGLKYWSPTVSGKEQVLQLNYLLDDAQEYSYLQGETANGKVTKEYTIRSTTANQAYSLKLYAFPTWLNDVSGYGLDYWMYDGTRQMAYKVPRSAVSLRNGSQAFDPFNFLSIQTLQVSVQMSVVDPNYGDYNHVQTLQVLLMSSGGHPPSNWKVKFTGSQPNWFGEGLEAHVTAYTAGISYLTLANGFTSQTDWLNAMYRNASPLYDPNSENNAPDPTHFIVVTATRQYEVPISQWATTIQFVNDVIEGGTLYIKWIKRMYNGDLQLAVTGVPVHNY